MLPLLLFTALEHCTVAQIQNLVKGFFLNLKVSYAVIGCF